MIVAITGVTGSGKSTVARLFEEWGGERIDADAIGREVWEKDGAVRERITAVLGPEILDADGEVDRARLGAFVFGDRDAHDAFDRVVQPILKERIEKELDRASEADERIWILDAALLFEWGVEDKVDRIVAVTAPEELRAARIARRHGLSPADARNRVKSQTSESRKAERSDYVIENDATKDALEKRARAVWVSIEALRPG